ncbi:hypothetical protein DV706_02440 [Natronorubrum bangense]|uniref:Uncharacterized protein n=2 Tax=Natronorubrum bangense TaxID=61858 RepID=L9WCA6_9EURY|nr:hypothetical protein [Natronorubrum bangense]ELY47120.1 hypothetical protein C494_12986 [Natronorubrum bangense JCM 10635]QCC53441.1 hypothetical protein DV706_02440 [Natronorubrum bangense]
MTTRNRRSVVATAGVAGAGGPASCLFDERWRSDEKGLSPRLQSTQYGAARNRSDLSNECFVDRTGEQHADVVTATELLEGA